jgi:subtilisin-like proprotein convertase family protein
MILRLLQFGGCLAAAIAIALPTASAQEFFGPGSDIPDFTTANGPGGTVSTITITENDSVTIGDLAVCIDGLTHTWVGDLIATITHTDLNNDSATATLFNRVGRGGFPGDGDASNLDGDYEFASTGASLWEESAMGSSGNGTQGTTDDEFVIAPGTYANVNAAGFDNNTSPNPSPISLAAIFGGRSSAGTWRINFSDNDANDIGSFDSTSIKFAAVNAVPEPGTFGLMAVASIGGLFYVRRKKKQTSIETTNEIS